MTNVRKFAISALLLATIGGAASLFTFVFTSDDSLKSQFGESLRSCTHNGRYPKEACARCEVLAEEIVRRNLPFGGRIRPYCGLQR